MKELWQGIIDDLGEHIALLRELGVESCEMDPQVLAQFMQAQRRAAAAPAPAPSPPERTTTALAECSACPLARERQGPPQNGQRNTANPDIMFIADLPLTGADRELLEKIMAAMGYTPAELYSTAVCKCLPATPRKITTAEARACIRYLREEIKAVNPKTIVLLGEAAIKAIFESAPQLRPQLNHWVSINRREIMSIRHPSYMRRFPAAKRDAWNALKEVLKRLGREPG